MTNTDIKILGVIPARLNSTRLPGKALRDICGKPMIAWVYMNARRSPLLTALMVATDSPEIEAACKAYDIPVMMTGEHPSGGDRLHEILTRTDADIYLNIQGDEPTIRPEHIELLIDPLVTGKAEVSTLCVAIDNEAAANPNNVKVVTSHSGRALYFSRHAIPYDRDGAGHVQHYKHIGLYGYTRASLALFHNLAQTSLELAEKLEQLRYLQNDVPMYVAETPYDTVGVDTEADLQAVIRMFTETNSTP
jgi:3-deoxy-manno-octulosonate cytidylyltransferase (CMP-KDO synthetase)